MTTDGQVCSHKQPLTTAFTDAIKPHGYILGLEGPELYGISHCFYGYRILGNFRGTKFSRMSPFRE